MFADRPVAAQAMRAEGYSRMGMELSGDYRKDRIAGWFSQRVIRVGERIYRRILSGSVRGRRLERAVKRAGRDPG